jgi:DNA polymerase/3'-5' exonuclease PolX
MPKTTIPLDTAKELAQSELERLSPVSQYGEVVGSVARQHPEVGDVDLLVIPKSDQKPTVKAPYNVFTSTAESFEPSLMHWISGKGIINLKVKAKQKGWKLTRYGLQTEKGLVTDAKQIYSMLESEIPEPVETAVDRWRAKSASFYLGQLTCLVKMEIKTCQLPTVKIVGLCGNTRRKS